MVPIVLGGDHSIAEPDVRACAEAHGGPIGLVRNGDRIIIDAAACQLNVDVPAAELESTTNRIAREIAAQPQHAIRMFKRVVYQSRDMSLISHLDMVSSHMSVLEDLEEQRAKVRAFADL